MPNPSKSGNTSYSNFRKLANERLMFPSAIKNLFLLAMDNPVKFVECLWKKSSTFLFMMNDLSLICFVFAIYIAAKNLSADERIRKVEDKKITETLEKTDINKLSNLLSALISGNSSQTKGILVQQNNPLENLVATIFKTKYPKDANKVEDMWLKLKGRLGKVDQRLSSKLSGKVFESLKDSFSPGVVNNVKAKIKINVSGELELEKGFKHLQVEDGESTASVHKTTRPIVRTSIIDDDDNKKDEDSLPQVKLKLVVENQFVLDSISDELGAKVEHVVIQSSDIKVEKNYFRSKCPNLKKITISEDVESVPDSIFTDCKQLQSVDILSKKCKNIGKDAFAGCNSLKTITISNGVTKIGEGAFSKCEKLNKFEVLNGNVDLIDKKAFAGCKKLKELRILTGSLGELAKGVFIGCSEKQPPTIICKSRKSIHLPSERNYDIASGDDDTVLIISSQDDAQSFGKLNKTVEHLVLLADDVQLPLNYFCEHYPNLKKITVSGNVKFIDDYLFMGCRQLQSVGILSEVCNYIGISSFENCSKLKTVVISKCIDLKIGKNAFKKCSQLKKFKVQEGNINDVGGCAFEDCKLLKKIKVPDSIIKSIDTDAFKNCPFGDVIATESDDIDERKYNIGGDVADYDDDDVNEEDYNTDDNGKKRETISNYNDDIEDDINEEDYN